MSKGALQIAEKRRDAKGKGEKERYKYLKEKAMATYFSTIAWKIPWTEKPGRLQSMRSLRVGHY